jgi:hypothetical protein
VIPLSGEGVSRNNKLSLCAQLKEKWNVVSAQAHAGAQTYPQISAMLIHMFDPDAKQMRTTPVTHSAVCEMHKATSQDGAATLRTISSGHPERDWMIRIHMIKRCWNVKNQHQ